ncbi:hypothetical protein [Legionella cincinnatiensis]|uniref:Dot/Icm T4SS effector n=1 Tax=Legionella cincinnatiensis TaxID=28085 RepID=A0A378IIA7_9GAMM|nr:hypothetical protein [Legionella cincinnatiensis]KTC81881.1 Dot/Icm T4SS effector [Legionella cincinnatiensis]STX34660.1 Dot/Icm T4SS effector [Legionella cincinnatiensis]
MFQVDNSGKGNCMYYAYSISLMYFLRAKNIPDVAEDIFNTLKLGEEEKVRLRVLLSKKSDQEFSSSEIKNIIEPILGKATRNLAAEYTKKEFKLSPQDTPLFSSAHYGLEFCFKCSMRINSSELSHLIEHEFDNPDYIGAEIYKVKGMDIAMHEYSLARLPYVVEKFNRQWSIKELECIQQKKELTEREIQSQKRTLLDNILRNETIEFFLGEEDKHLDQYAHHLQQNGVWGTEETLFVLHRAIQGEHLVRNQEGRAHILYDREIILHLYRNDGISYDQSGSPEMIVNNKGNVHWTSIIPDSIFVLKYTPQEQRLYQLLDDMQMEYESIPQGSEKQASISSDWIHALRVQIGAMKDNPSQEAKEKAMSDSMQILGKMMPILGNYPYWRVLLAHFFTALLECIPTLMADKKISSGLIQCESLLTTRPHLTPVASEKKELSPPDITNTEERPSQSQKEMVSKFSQHTLFKKPSTTIQRAYPEEIARYIRENKQTGPRVAKVLRKMYQEGLHGSEEYSPEKCREIAQRYIGYVKYQGRHFVLEDVVHFIKEMDEVIKQKEENLEEFIEHVDGMKFN